MQQVAALWAANVSAFIGPQETCVHEGRMAAAFNLPMISYVSTYIFLILGRYLVYFHLYAAPLCLGRYL